MIHDKNRDATQIDMLLRSHNLEDLDSTLWNDKCDYIELDNCANLNPINYNLIIMQLNIRSLVAHQMELKQSYAQLKRKTHT